MSQLTKAFYNTVLCQSFSPCGNYLIVGDIYGSLSIFHLSKVVNNETIVSKEELLPKNTIVVKENFQVNSLLQTENHLIVGGVKEIVAYHWKKVKTSKNPQPDWKIEIPNDKAEFGSNDVNCLQVFKDQKRIYAGCGDNNIYIFDLETRQLEVKLQGHKDYIHSLCSLGKELISTGEDGVVNIWDLKTNKIINSVIPYKYDKISRPSLGKWLGAVSCNEDYILCGGGPRLSLWHYRFLSNSTVFPIEDKGIHVAEIYKDKIFAGGRSKLFYQMNFIGDVITEIPVSATTTYSAIHQEEPFKVLCIAGSNSKIDICSNFMYKDQQLSLY